MASLRCAEVGDRPTNRYYFFSITVELGKKLKYADYGKFKKRCETVYVRELNRIGKPIENTSQLLRASSG